MSEKIKIVKLGSKSQPSKFKPGETYTITTIMDEKERKMSAMGAWAEGWKVGDEVEVNIEEKKWTDRDGFEQTNLVLKNPNQKPYTGGGGYRANPMIQSFEIAARLAPILFEGKKKVKLDDIEELAKEIRKRTEVSVIPEQKEKVPEIDVKKETEKKDSDFDDKDDEKPF